MKYFPVLVFACILALSSCKEETASTAAAPSFSIDSVKAQISASNAKYGASFANNDSATFLASYTGDACLYAPNAEALCSGEGIAMFFRQGYQMGIRDIKLTTSEVVGGPDAVAETGKYELMSSDGKTMDKGKFIVIWKPVNGQWKMYRDIFNTDMPGMPPPAK